MRVLRVKEVLILGVVVVFGLLTMGYVFETRIWQYWSIDSEWGELVVEKSFKLRELLEDYKKVHGEFPDDLSDIPNEYSFPSEFSNRGNESKWYYRKIGGEDYQIYATAAHFVSSFDAMVFRYSQKYPKDWFGLLDSYHSKKINDWYYITGFSSLESDL